MAPAIVWFRNDLRLDDNPALMTAARSGAPLIALYVLDDDSAGQWRMGDASRWWLHHSLSSLADDLAQHGVPLVLRRGRAEFALEEVIAETGTCAAYWNRLYEPWAMRRDNEIKTSLRGRGLTVESFNGSLLFEPAHMRNRQGETFKVFSPFWRACLAAGGPQAPSPAPAKLDAAPAPASDTLDEWGLLPKKPDWARGLRDAWRPGEASARACLSAFAKNHALDYKLARDDIAGQGASRLSPHLHFGEISPRRVWAEIMQSAGEAGLPYLRELGWREFFHHLLVSYPEMPERALDRRFDDFPWRDDPSALEAWRRGRTGYPLVDAAMRELWLTGFMYNRARMVAASFLVKHLLLPWQEGARWFWDTLVDADLANNSGNWQWIAGCGADAAPYFRVFNPVLQGAKFDPEGVYVRRFVPELAGLESRWIHRPWEAPAHVLAAAGVTLGETYPRPIVDHAAARALAAFEEMRASSADSA
ncbi:DNA photolyase family protein [Methylocystis sp. MJC1]|jgi:deoxyribodipyrimidine photo-lyase|uniref:cryptochrome/photolyase family protein n=1 Tax=Methylocystis sp. MJC1 TaxID=2654282 RepID=UPI0013EC6A08|nr:deoxyribodipyrimidine photo-lyase [Methylocystis sp. MJC1]KAF2990947.1 Deoxyribodipyrimidine photo-lyase [Methylocystis sp. MJC1]MBU6527838.1 deoxyribodipyrimidine photo-lyase [Methylocystis sp. MJC1]UZX10763.1 DNA photolyase family protein [Methylocystis sp. MJC1]